MPVNLESLANIVRQVVMASVACLSVCAPAGAQTSQPMPSTVSPLRSDPDVNQVNIADGQTTQAIPAVAVPAAPRLRFDLVQNVMPLLVAVISPESVSSVSSVISIHHGQNESANFRCRADDVCDSTRLDGSFIDGQVAVGGTYYFTQKQTGAVYTFDQLQYDSGLISTNRQIRYYASSILYPDGETISFTYDTFLSGTYRYYRVTRVSSSIGYYIDVTYQGADPQSSFAAWEAPAQATLVRATAPSVPLAQQTYGANGQITDLAGRVFTCVGCANRVSAGIQLNSAQVTLPGEVTVHKVITPYYAPGQSAAVPPLVGSVVRDGVTWTYTYANYRTAGSATLYGYDSVTVAGPNGYNVQYNVAVGVQGQPNLISSKVDSIGRTTSYTYDAFSRVTAIQYPEGNRDQITYDVYGNIINLRRVSKPGSGLADIVEAATFDSNACLAKSGLCSRPMSFTDSMGRTTDYSYDAAGRLVSEIGPPDSNGTRTAKYYTYGTSFTAPTVIRVCGVGTTCGTSGEFRTEYTYLGYTSLPISMTVVDGVAGTSFTTAYAYDDAGRLLSADPPKSGDADAKFYRYDVLGRKTWEIGAAGVNGVRPAVRSTYRSADDKITLVERGTISDANSATLVVNDQDATAYDARRNPIRSATSSSGTTLVVKDVSFNERGQQICSTVRMNPAVFGALPSDACTLSTTAAQGPDRVTRNSYDAAGQLLLVQRAFGITTANGFPTTLQQDYVTYTYTLNGKQASVRDANGNLATMAYDGFDRLQMWTFPSKTTAGLTNASDYEQYSYDMAGNRLTLRKRDGVTISYQYDALNRLTLKSVPTSASGAAGYNVYYGYDLRGLQLFARFGSATGAGITNTYDGYGRLTATQSTMGGTSRTVSFQYDANGNRTRVQHPDNARFDIAYDSADRPASASWTTATGATTDFLAMSYDGLGRRVGQQVGNVLARLIHDGPAVGYSAPALPLGA